MNDGLQLKHEYITMISSTRIIISYYNKEHSKIIEYMCSSDMSKCHTSIYSLVEAVSHSIRGESFNKRISVYSGAVVYDEETAKFLLKHAVDLDDMKNKLKDYVYDKTGIKIAT